MANKNKAAANAAKTDLSVVNAHTSISDAVAVISKQIENLGFITDSKYKVAHNGPLGDGFGDLTKETKLTNLVRAYSSVKNREKFYNEALEDLGLTNGEVEPFSINGGDAEAWLADIKLRIAILQNEDNLNELKTLKTEYEALMDKEDKKALLAQKMQKVAAKYELIGESVVD